MDAVLPLLHGPLGSDGSLIESLSALEISSTDDPTVAESMEKSCIGNCKNLAGELMSRHRCVFVCFNQFASTLVSAISPNMYALSFRDSTFINVALCYDLAF